MVGQKKNPIPRQFHRLPSRLKRHLLQTADSVAPGYQEIRRQQHLKKEYQLSKTIVGYQIPPEQNPMGRRQEPKLSDLRLYMIPQQWTLSRHPRKQQKMTIGRPICPMCQWCSLAILFCGFLVDLSSLLTFYLQYTRRMNGFLFITNLNLRSRVKGKGVKNGPTLRHQALRGQAMGLHQLPRYKVLWQKTLLSTHPITRQLPQLGDVLFS